MEMEYKDTSRRGKWIIVLGIALALAAGGAAFFLINQAQQQAGSAGLQKVPVVVATRVIPARKPIEAGDLLVRQVPVDPTNSQGIFSDPANLIGKVPGVSILQDQMITANLLASNAQGSQFSILGPEESVTPDSPFWRAVSLTVPDDRAVGGLVQVGQTVDVFVTATVNVPQSVLDEGKYYTDKSTKITYQDIPILAKSGTFYIIKITEAVAEEIVHLQSSGTAQFSFALRPIEDTRSVDATKLGETTNLIIERYGLPVPQTYPVGKGPLPTGAGPEPFPTPVPASPSPSSSASPAP